ncbi:polyribonucleotide nucleotidyltransferase [Candidatus Falkowbacteria bacterium]|nr:polyribonucleotide nucleotidyltransferase [Candidatus Falkowbacteria bacterium]
MNGEQSFTTKWLGRDLTFKTGKLAKHANSAVTVQYGETVVLATVVESKEEKDIDWFPLMVSIEERLYAAGIIKGSRWIKREGRPTDEAVLAGRMIDRSIRPLFSGESRKDVQVMLTVLSVDKENDHDIVGLVAASAALAISGVDWDGPIGGIRVGKIEDKFVFNPTYEEREKSNLDLIVVGTEQKTIMIEAGAKEAKEQEIFEAIKAGQKELQGAVELIKEMKNKIVVDEDKKVEEKLSEAEIEAREEKTKLINIANEWLKENVNKILFNKEHYKTKKERKASVTAIKTGLNDYLFDKGIEKNDRTFAIKKTVEKAIDGEVTREIVDNERRVDGRGLTEIRGLEADVEILPRNHGAGLFSRGETQVMSIVTLGPPGLEQLLEGIEGTGTKRFMHHYNFPPFSVGEARPVFGPSRRDIGHGALAEKALEQVIPSKEDFPYIIRIVSETLGSNGSSSMASTCAATLALMDAGVPIKKPVAGIAIGLASNDDMSKWKVLTDIQDLEDGKGGMDFKVTGTSEGITAIQLDTKTNGLTEEIIAQALKQGREAINQILNVINESIAAPREELSKYAPRVITLNINPERIRDVIGPGGKIINKIIDETGVSIDIEDDGSVFIASAEAEGLERAVQWVKDLTHEVEAGEVYEGKVVRIMDFGAFVEILPGKDGLVHISELAHARTEKVEDVVKIGDVISVKVIEIDKMGRINLSFKATQPMPDGPISKDFNSRKKDDKPGGFFKRKPRR